MMGPWEEAEKTVPGASIGLKTRARTRRIKSYMDPNVPEKRVPWVILIMDELDAPVSKQP